VKLNSASLLTLSGPKSALVSALLLGCLVGCGGTLQRQPATPLALTGTWVLMPEQSDDVIKLIKAALPVPKPLRRVSADDSSASAQPMGSESGGRPEGGAPRAGHGSHRRASDTDAHANPNGQPPPPAYGKVKPLEFVKAFVWPATRLEVLLSQDQIRINSDGRVRNLEPGSDTPYSVSDRFGSRAIQAGYHNQSLVIRSQDSTRLSVDESFSREHEFLVETIKFQAHGFRTLTVHLKYRPITSSDSSAPLDGPPAPSGH
jgi:hypothetical protein